MNLQQTKVTERQQNKKSTSLAGYECIQSPTTNEDRPHPRCLATLPSNIEELICQFKMQENGFSLVSQTYIK